jgi:hypothetical protein
MVSFQSASGHNDPAQETESETDGAPGWATTQVYPAQGLHVMTAIVGGARQLEMSDYGRVNPRTESACDSFFSDAR